MTPKTQAPDPAPVPAGFALIPLESSDALLRPFYECPPEELKLAWQAMHMIAKKMHPAPAIPAPDADYVRRLAEDWAADCVKAGYVTTGAASHKVMAEAINALAIPAPEGDERAVFEAWYEGKPAQHMAACWNAWVARAALAAPAPQAPVALTDEQIDAIVTRHFRDRRHPDSYSALRETIRDAIAGTAPVAPRQLTDEELAACCGGCRSNSAIDTWMRRAIAEFCRVNGIPAPQTKEPTNDS